MPGIGEEMEGAMQHAPHPARQSMAASVRVRGAPASESCRLPTAAAPSLRWFESYPGMAENYL